MSIWSFKTNTVGFGNRFHYLLSLLAAGLILSFLSSIILGACRARTEETFHFADLAMGTIVRLTVLAPDKKIAEKAANKSFAVIHQLEKDLDHRNPQGSVGRINASAGIEPVGVTPEAFSLIDRALEFCEKTEGVFDISIGAVTVTPDYYSEASAEDKKKLVNYRLIQLNKKERTVFLPRKGMRIDLGGLAKGTVIDYASRTLEKEGISAGIVEAGGDFYCFGNKKWKAGIQHPRQDALLGRISVKQTGVCGSGDYYQYIIDDDNGQQERKHHILDPKKMRSARESISVTVLASTTEKADALATTLFIMGPQKGKVFLKKEFPDAFGLWVLPGLTIIKTDNFPQFLEK